VTAELVVLYQDQIAGTLTRVKGGKLVLRFSDAYRLGSKATSISTGISLSQPEHTGQHLRNWLWGLLPDNENVLTRWGRMFSVSIGSPFGLLSTEIGEDCPGAFSFVKPERVDAMMGNKGQVEWLNEKDLAAIVRELRADASAWLGSDPPGRFSLSGAQTKTALLWDGARWGRPSGATATTHIVKPAISGLDEHDLNEHLCLRAAAAAGLVVVDTALHSFEDQTALFVRRYDRFKRNNHQVRVHQEDLCQALGISPAKKYQNEGGPSPKMVAELIRLTIPAPIDVKSIESFADALIWNWIIAGPDAHAKNYSFLLSGAEVRLAPLYDISSTLAYPSISQQRIRLGMKFGTDYSIDARAPTWPTLARGLGIQEESLRSRAERLISVVPDAFATAASLPDVQALSTKLPAKLKDAVAKRAKRCAVQATLR
jgi:serine/threonine-protein kinase HipA